MLQITYRGERSFYNCHITFKSLYIPTMGLQVCRSLREHGPFVGSYQESADVLGRGIKINYGA